MTPTQVTMHNWEGVSRYCKGCKKPMILLVRWNSNGHLWVCDNVMCDKYRSPQGFVHDPGIYDRGKW